MAAALKVLAVALLVALSLAGGVSAETHHVVGGDGGWGPDFNVSAWLSDRLFSVGDKLRFEHSGGDESIVEVGNSEEFETCNLSNPIRKLTSDAVSHVALEEEGVRYFSSGDPERCRNGLKLPVAVQRSHDHDHDHDFDPYKPDEPSHYEPYKPDEPSPYDPYKPDVPSPPYEPYQAPPPPHHYPSAATRLHALCFVCAAAMVMSIYCPSI